MIRCKYMMESLGKEKPVGGQAKVVEYIRRIQNGEPKSLILQGLPESFKDAIEEGLTQSTKGELGVTGSEGALKIEGFSVLNIEERRELYGWPASYELAKIAKQQGVDLSKMSREDYVDFAIRNSLAIDDDQLRVAPWQRMGTSVEEIISGNKERKGKINEESEKSFAKFCYETQQKAGQENRFLLEGIKVRQGTKDSNSWLFFGINNGIGEKNNETYKSYISIKDLNILTPEKFTKFMTALRDAKYNGDIKIFQDLSEQGIRLNDQVVMHGSSKEDAELALQVAEQFFGKNLDQKSLGKDEVIDGKNMSYSEILAKRIKEGINLGNKDNVKKI